MDTDTDRHACDTRFPGPQSIRLMRRAIERARLDLTGLRVLTEAAVGYRRLTPVLAALAGADEVFAVARDTAVTSRKEAEEQTRYLAHLAHVEDRVKLVPTRLQAPLAGVDIVTDLPGVRPVDESVLRTVAETAAVTLMKSTSTWRAADADAATCRRRSIAIAGVDEEAVGLYRYLPLGVISDLLDLGVEIAGATIIVTGGGQSGEGQLGPGHADTEPTVRSAARHAYVVQALERLGARVLVAAPESAGRTGLFGGEKIGDCLGDETVLGRLAEADALVLCPGTPDERWVGPGDEVGAARLTAAAPHLAVVGSGAELDLAALAAAGLRCRPSSSSGGLFDLLPQPLIVLHTAGLKVGEVMTKARRRGSSPLAAEQIAAEDAHAELLPKDLGATRR